MEILKNDLAGTVVVYIETRGFGFLYCPSEHRRIFFHRSKFHRAKDPIIDEQVVFDLAPSKLSGKPSVAVNVRPVKTDEDVSAKIAPIVRILSGGPQKGDGGAL
jgi:cold shock CspA family protein